MAALLVKPMRPWAAASGEFVMQKKLGRKQPYLFKKKLLMLLKDAKGCMVIKRGLVRKLPSYGCLMSMVSLVSSTTVTGETVDQQSRRV